MLSKLVLTNQIVIISGMARGADALGVRYANDNNFRVIDMPADWNGNGKSAGYIRNTEMAKIATHCICFWDSKSKGTQHMINLAQSHNLKTHIVHY